MSGALALIAGSMVVAAASIGVLGPRTRGRSTSPCRPAKLTEKGQVVIPAAIRARYGLTPGTQVEFVDEGGTIRLLIRRLVARVR